MCGIAGIISNDASLDMSAALAAIEHRGRDDEGIYRSQPLPDGSVVTLGHRRLSIIDTSAAGHQPMLTPDGRFAIVLNGEIYNYREIREDLAAFGETFATGTDTEVLLLAFAKWGVDCLEKLNGMFAFAVWDDRDKVLTLARDRAGIKPLFYAETQRGFGFASEAKALFAAGLIEPELDRHSLEQFLTFLWPVPPRTMFSGVWQLMPGHYVEFRNGKITDTQWWDLDLSAEERGGSTQDWADEVAATLDRVVGLEMVADVPVGAFLSGGVDSSVIVALMTRHSTSRVSAYTTSIAADDLRHDIIPDDVQWSRRMAEQFDLDHHEIALEPDVAELLPKLIYHQEAPVIDMAIPSYLISERARETQTVMLSGMGGDEIFGGYPRQMAMKLAGITDVLPSAVRRPLMSTIDSALYGAAGGKFGAVMRNAKKFARSASLDLEERYLGFGTYFTDEMRARLYTPASAAAVADVDPYEYHRHCFEKASDLPLVNKLLYVDFKTFMPALNLDTTDRTSMAANLEVRVPFLNKELIDLSARIPSRLKIKGIECKFILKKAAERFLPKEVIWRKKAGFGAPLRSWLKGPLKPLVDDLLSRETVEKRGLFRPDEVDRVVDSFISGREDTALQIFQLVTLELWMRRFIDR
jgi:asparagine synthase (glutamine-hydrolysing)